MDWKLTKQQLFLILIYSSLVPFSSYIGEAFSNIAIVINAPFLPIGWFGGKLLVSIFETETVYAIGLFIAIFLQVYLVVINVKHYLKKDQANLVKLILRITIMLSIFLAAIFALRLLYI